MGRQDAMKISKTIAGIIAGILVVGMFWYINVQSQAVSERKVVTIGIAQWISSPDYDRNIAGFKEGLAENGYVEGHNIRFIIQNAQIDKEKQRDTLQSFIDENVDLIYSLGTPGTLIVKEMIQDRPIVFSFATYPVETGLIDSLVHSGNNLVGTTNYLSIERQYDQFEKIYHDTKRLAFVHGNGEPDSGIQYNEMKDLLNKKGITAIDIAAVDFNDIRSQLEIVSDSVDSLYAACDTLIQSGGEEVVVKFSKEYRKPSFTCNENGVLKGALIGNVADPYSIGKISGRQASLILEGAKPALLLTEAPREDFVLINIKTAEELEITLPQSILDSAKEIIDE